MTEKQRGEKLLKTAIGVWLVISGIIAIGLAALLPTLSIFGILNLALGAGLLYYAKTPEKTREEKLLEIITAIYLAIDGIMKLILGLLFLPLIVFGILELVAALALLYYSRD